jgi:hypothetical protein
MEVAYLVLVQSVLVMGMVLLHQVHKLRRFHRQHRPMKLCISGSMALELFLIARRLPMPSAIQQMRAVHFLYFKAAPEILPAAVVSGVRLM